MCCGCTVTVEWSAVRNTGLPSQPAASRPDRRVATGEAYGLVCNIFQRSYRNEDHKQRCVGRGRKLVINPKVSIMLMIKFLVSCVSNQFNSLLSLTTYLHITQFNIIITFHWTFSNFPLWKIHNFLSCLLKLSHFISLARLQHLINCDHWFVK